MDLYNLNCSEDDFDKLMSKAKEGDHEALCALGYFFIHGVNGQVDKQLGLYYYLEAAKLGSAHAMYNAGCMYMSGDGTKKSYKKAAEYFSDAFMCLSARDESDSIEDTDYITYPEYLKRKDH